MNLSDTVVDDGATSVQTENNTNEESGGLPAIATHFIVVGSLFGLVVLMGLANLYIHYYGDKEGGRTRLQAVYGVGGRNTRARGSGGDGGKKHKTSVTIKMKPVSRK